MEIKNIIDTNLVKTDLQGLSKEEVLAELGNLLLQNGNVTNADKFIEDVYKREAEGQTGIGNYVAIPHGKSEFVKNVGVAIGISDHEIPWESLDDKGAKVIILFAVGDDTESAQEHLKLLSLFARKLGNDEVIDQLLQSKTTEEVIDSFA